MLIVIATKTDENQYNLAPIAWNCPVEYEPITRLLFVCDKEHQTYINCRNNKEFGVVVPHASQVEMVKKIGSCSGKETDKFKNYSIDSFSAETIDVMFPIDAIGYLECNIYQIIDDGSVAIIMGQVKKAIVKETAFNKRILAETPQGKALHHLGGKTFITTANTIY